MYDDLFVRKIFLVDRGGGYMLINILENFLKLIKD